MARRVAGSSFLLLGIKAQCAVQLLFFVALQRRISCGFTRQTSPGITLSKSF